MGGQGVMVVGVKGVVIGSRRWGWWGLRGWWGKEGRGGRVGGGGGQGCRVGDGSVGLVRVKGVGVVGVKG